MILLLCTCLDGSGDVADGDGVGLSHARGAGAVSAARRRADRPVRRAHGHRARRVLIAAPPGCTPGVLPAMSSGTAGAAVAHAGAALATGPPHHRLSHEDSPHSPASTPHTTTRSRHRLPLAARFHSTARAPAHTFLVPARSPRKTRPSCRPPRSARRPLVRPTSFMRTTTPRSPPAKALRTMSRLRCAQSLHECGQKAASSLQVLLADACGHHVMIAPASTLCVACLRHAAVLSE